MKYVLFSILLFGFFACKSSATRENERLQEKIDARYMYMDYLNRFGLKADSMWRDRGEDLWILDEMDSLRRADSLKNSK
jgi:hypothetical protein